MSDTEIIIGGDSVDIPPGRYAAILVSITTLNSPAFGDFRKWEFQLPESQGSHRVSGASSLSTSKKSKGYRWTAALLGKPPEKGTVQLAGKKALIDVVEDKDGWPKVEDVFPMAPEAPQATQTPATVETGELPF